MKFNVVISTFLQISSILSLSWLQNFLQKERISLVLTSLNCSLSNPEIMNKALEQSLLKSSLEQISWASHLLPEFEGRKSRTWKLLNKSCDDKIHVQYSYNLSYAIPAGRRAFLYLWLGSRVQQDVSLVRWSRAHSWDIELNARGETQYLRAPCDIPNILFPKHIKQFD